MGSCRRWENMAPMPTQQFLIRLRLHQNMSYETMWWSSPWEKLENVIQCKCPLEDKIEKMTKVLGGLMSHHPFWVYFVIFNS